ncbi:MAG TPA: YbjQ family protein [Acidimicrobiia bacterium]
MNEFAFQALFVLILLVVGFGFGRVQELRHLRDLEDRERRLAAILVTDLRIPPTGIEPSSGHLVIGGAVIASDYFKTFASGIRSLVGGELRSYQSMLGRARREAQARMLEEARRIGAQAVINVRFETSEIGSRAPMSEIICYGTALLTRESVGTSAPS